MRFIRLFFKTYAHHRAVGFSLRRSFRCSWAFTRLFLGSVTTPSILSTSKFGCIRCGKFGLSLSEADDLEAACDDVECRLGMTE
jgi:hypothetical protein